MPRLRAEDVDCEKRGFSDVLVALPLVAVEEGLHHEVNVGVGHLSKGEGFDQALLGLCVVDESALGLPLPNKLNDFLLAQLTLRNYGFSHQLFVLLPLFQETEQQGNSIRRELAAKIADCCAGSRPHLPRGVLKALKKHSLDSRADFPRGNSANRPQNHSFELGICARVGCVQKCHVQSLNTEPGLCLRFGNLTKCRRYGFLN